MCPCKGGHLLSREVFLLGLEHWGARLISTLKTFLLGQGHGQKCVTCYLSGSCAYKCKNLQGEVIA